ncbi:MAG: bifunctional (p)ppGpp synthetase/guanosine-3',5'-bis(diphosphate) 3'-pyrophosphohydrolase [Flavobacteriales bacterium]|jgi:GTP diphosphokinase / guanosine-3',5'-bis(diphosphate) 3'-diphosphatase|nr:bifunctional (p)ppGpp synthetase/guanosine-3',5'-bis(diphosphate) 3'-pyrophosphohydrolase [Flavobacteriales bacterium]MBT3963389.1 bifunctional (p)ppGpp synthetase/guanosine-3',5'-bis(diphosphate) 3'-pyrophosphohydrolase [Flavobacteriales bacterium]MBT4704537.1 bifunctional (p)ppGpp synthetase/guanosine-3',5'-bis(diphosphate) 3'-pyrophosphohydrolase [Flavobacteriales bacterium]MBT4931292.1 bifunctional (p)ppGpp synthetase/guanosine-3',5'-bis(diphosphate) 3'-pyrophosphohydrolase [Flavobacteria
MTETEIANERRAIAREYRALLKNSIRVTNEADKLLIRKAFDLAVEAHSETRRKSGEAYIFHPIAVARIVSEEIGLGTTSIVCALLHDVVEDTEITLEDIEGLFGDRVALIIDGLTKITGATFTEDVSMQAENFRKMLLTLSEDVRVILIKLADRLHNMRTLDSMSRNKQQKIASETLFLYAPLSHRLGLYNIKSELEDLCLKYKEVELYQKIEQSLKKSQAVRTRFINRFVVPIKRTLEEAGLGFEIKSRTKSIYSIYNKMLKKDIPFEEVYDLFAVRIILNSREDEEKSECWKAYSVVTDHYKPNPDRLRDWISTPKSNGYESLHTTVMSPTGKWVEVQIRTNRMDEIAEMGYAAHWKYKESASENALDEWIKKIRDTLQNPDPSAFDFIDDFKLNLFSDEIFLFTPTGDLKTLPNTATALDFAFEIHTQVGAKCMGVKVNHKLVPLSYRLRSGDQVEILTSPKQKPKEDWLRFVVTAKAKSNIKSLLKEEKKKIAEDGKEIFTRKLRSLKIDGNEANIRKIQQFFKFPSSLEMYYQLGLGKLDLNKLKDLKKEKGQLKYRGVRRKKSAKVGEIVTKVNSGADLLIGDSMENLEYKLSQCCNPIPGDNVFGFITVSDGIKIHRENCPNAIQLMSNYAYRIVKAKWTNADSIAFLAGIKINGIDQMGLVSDVTRVISSEYNVNMRSINFDTDDGIFKGEIKVYVNDTTHLTELMRKLRNINGVTTVSRIKGDQLEPSLTDSN